jgi:hypothetical protein
MNKKLIGAILGSLTLSTPALAQEATQTDTKADVMMETGAEQACRTITVELDLGTEQACKTVTVELDVGTEQACKTVTVDTDTEQAGRSWKNIPRVEK